MGMDNSVSDIFRLSKGDQLHDDIIWQTDGSTTWFKGNVSASKFISKAVDTNEGGQLTLVAAIGRSVNWQMDNYVDRLRIFRENYGGGGGAEYFSMIDGGNLGLGDSNPSSKLVVNGTVTCTSLTETSDERVKENIANISGSLGKVLSLTGRSFNWKDEVIATDPYNLSGSFYGLVAQEVEQVVPELVNTAESGSIKYSGSLNLEYIKSVNTQQIVPLLIESIKEQQTTINNLITRVTALENQ